MGKTNRRSTHRAKSADPGSGWVRRFNQLQTRLSAVPDSALDTFLLYGTFGLLMFGPLAFGAVDHWSTFVLEAGALLLFLVWLIKQSRDREIVIQWNPLFLPMAGFAVLVVAQIAFRSSAYPHDTVSSTLLYCAYALLCFLSGQALLRGAEARKLAFIFTIYGVAIAGFALLYGISPNGKLYWVYPTHGGWIYGPYVNHNHYAGLMELLAPIPLVVALTRMADDRQRIAGAVAAAIMVGTIFLSGSRGGMLAIVVELAVLAGVVLRQKKIVRGLIGLAAFAVVLATMLTWLGGKELTARVSSISTESRAEISGGMRFSIDRDSIRMFRQRPVLGWGLGSFPVVYPQFRSFYTNFFVNEAHNDYLQLLTEMGLLGFATMLWFLVVLFRNALPKMKNWSSDVNDAVTLACLAGLSGILVHSIFDFNLQIPANAAIFYVFCTIAAAPPLLQRSRKRKPALPTSEEQLLPASEVV
jgi:O-antigen ligase